MAEIVNITPVNKMVMTVQCNGVHVGDIRMIIHMNAIEMIIESDH